MTEPLKPRSRKVKILATLGPASSKPEMIRKLMQCGADAFRINMSHGDQKSKAKLVEAIRALETELRRPTTIVATRAATRPSAPTERCASAPPVATRGPRPRSRPRRPPSTERRRTATT